MADKEDGKGMVGRTAESRRHRFVESLTRNPLLSREQESYTGMRWPYRVLAALAAAAVLLAAMLPLSGNMAPGVQGLHPLFVAAVLLTEPFLWSLLFRSRTHPVAYLALIAANLGVLVYFLSLHHHGDHTQVLYFLLVLASFDFAVDIPVLNRIVPLVLVLTLGGSMPVLPLSVGVAMVLVVALREFRLHFQRRQHRSVEMLRDEIREVKAAGYRDRLTGLYNRGIITDRVEELFEHCRREGKPFGVAFIDIDRLKEANDTQGHAFGDRIIAHASSRLLAAKRSGDFAVRYGGDEFLLITTDAADYGELGTLAERLRQAVRSEPVDGFTVTLSIGCALFPETEAIDLQDLLRQADHALYAAKRRGRDQVVCLDDAEAMAS